jgi:hypothetical protein
MACGRHSEKFNCHIKELQMRFRSDILWRSEVIALLENKLIWQSKFKKDTKR